MPGDSPTSFDRTTMAAGTPVVLREDNGSLTFTKTRSLPWQLGEQHGHKSGPWVVKVEDRAGCYSLDRITPNTPMIKALAMLAAKELDHG